MTDGSEDGEPEVSDNIDITFSPNTEYHVSIYIGDLPDGLQRFVSKLGHKAADLMESLSLPEEEEE